MEKKKGDVVVMNMQRACRRRRQQKGSGLVRKKVNRLQKLVPGGHGLGLDQLCLQTADYINQLRFKVDVLQAIIRINKIKKDENIMSSPTKRRDMDVMKLMMSDHTVETINDQLNEFYVEFHGPKDSPYEGGYWKIRVELPSSFPYKSPSIGFVNKIFHPNVDEKSGAICLDVINQSWSPMFDLLNVFEVFLPQLLLYPNPSDPLNDDAAVLMLKDRKQYDQKVKDYCLRYARKEDITQSKDEESDDDSDDHSSSPEDDTDDIKGHLDP